MSDREDLCDKQKCVYYRTTNEGLKNINKQIVEECVKLLKENNELRKELNKQ